jgi:antitoxin YefM
MDSIPYTTAAQDARQSVVIISLDDEQSLEATAFLLRSPKNAERLLDSIAELEAGNGTERELFPNPLDDLSIV